MSEILTLPTGLLIILGCLLLLGIVASLFRGPLHINGKEWGFKKPTPPAVLPPVPIGTIVLTVVSVPGIDALPDWLLCDGRIIEKERHPALYKTLRNLSGSGNFGEDGQVRLPDLQGKAPVGAGEGECLDESCTGHRVAEAGRFRDPQPPPIQRVRLHYIIKAK